LPTTSDEPAIRLEKVSKRFHLRDGTTLKEFLATLLHREQRSSFYALNDVSLSVAKGETLGIIGRNGSGKSTILKLIAGVTAPTQGAVEVYGRVSPLIELGAGFHPDLTGRENVFLNGAILGMSRRTILERWDDIVTFAELSDFMETPVKHYSSGMFMRLGFSVAVHSDPDILIVDEALSVGDAAFQEKCLERIRSYQRQGVTIVFVSHIQALIENLCSRAVYLDHGRVIQDGPASEVLRGYRAALAGTFASSLPDSEPGHSHDARELDQVAMLPSSRRH
jgi:ABC-2 type transport system ATP-binding protein